MKNIPARLVCHNQTGSKHREGCAQTALKSGWNTLSLLWHDEAGFVVSSELILVATILMIGVIAGLTTVRDAVVTELADVADAVSEVDQSYDFIAITTDCGTVAGSTFVDNADFCELGDLEGDVNDQNEMGGAQCVTICQVVFDSAENGQGGG